MTPVQPDPRAGPGGHRDRRLRRRGHLVAVRHRTGRDRRLRLRVRGVPARVAIGTGFKAQKDEIERRIRDIESAIKNREKRLDDLAASTQNLLVGSDAGAMLAGYRQFTAMREDRRRHLSAMRALGDTDSLSVALAEAVQDQGRVESATEELLAGTPWLSGMTDPGRLGVEITRQKTEIASREEEREGERDRGERLRLEIAGLSARIDFDLPRLAESAKEKRAQVRDLGLEKDALREAIDTLDACIKEFQESDVFRLSDEMSQIFARITGDKYTRVHLGPSLEPLVATGDRVGIRPEELSAGAHDQLYFAMRIAMVRHLSRNIRLADLPGRSVRQLRLRAAAVTREVLKSLPDHQVVLVSCDRNYQAWTQHVVDLDQVRGASSRLIVEPSAGHANRRWPRRGHPCFFGAQERVEDRPALGAARVRAMRAMPRTAAPAARLRRPH